MQIYTELKCLPKEINTPGILYEQFKLVAQHLDQIEIKLIIIKNQLDDLKENNKYNYNQIMRGY